MAKISTKELFDAYFSKLEKSVQQKTRSQVDRPEVYIYESKIGKQLIDMNVDELFEMIMTFRNNRDSDDKNYIVAYNSYTQISSLYRSIWNFYIDNYEVIKNPWYDKRMRGVTASKRLMENKKAYTIEDFNAVLNKIEEYYSDADRVCYLECILLLFLEGFYNAEEIVDLTEDMIDFYSNEIKFKNKTIKLSNKCMGYLKHVHKLKSIEGWRGELSVVPYRNGYFKYIIRKKEEEGFQDRKKGDILEIINRRIAHDINDKLNEKINYKLVFYLGFYMRLSREVGSDRAKELVLSVRNSQDAKELMDFAQKDGLEIYNISHLKKNLLPYID